jgi:hypothetical protein
MTTYAIPGLVYDDGTPVTFEADDNAAGKLNLRSLLRRATRRVDSPDITFGFEDPVTKDDWREREEAELSAYDFAKHTFTNFAELAEPLYYHTGNEPYLCEPCRQLQRIERETDHSQNYGLIAACETCTRNADALDARLGPIELAVAAWIRSRWPDLALDSERGGQGAFGPEELAAAVLGLTRLPVTKLGS